MRLNNQNIFFKFSFSSSYHNNIKKARKMCKSTIWALYIGMLFPFSVKQQYSQPVLFAYASLPLRSQLFRRFCIIKNQLLDQRVLGIFYCSSCAGMSRQKRYFMVE